jgi:CBS-domain-containing membrane protein
MTKDVIFCRTGDLLEDVWSIMKERKLLHVPIVDEDFRPLGVINARDALRVLLEGSDRSRAPDGSRQRAHSPLSANGRCRQHNNLLAMHSCDRGLPRATPQPVQSVGFHAAGTSR